MKAQRGVKTIPPKNRFPFLSFPKTKTKHTMLSQSICSVVFLLAWTAGGALLVYWGQLQRDKFLLADGVVTNVTSCVVHRVDDALTIDGEHYHKHLYDHMIAIVDVTYMAQGAQFQSSGFFERESVTRLLNCTEIVPQVTHLVVVAPVANPAAILHLHSAPYGAHDLPTNSYTVAGAVMFALLGVASVLACCLCGWTAWLHAPPKRAATSSTTVEDSATAIAEHDVLMRPLLASVV